MNALILVLVAYGVGVVVNAILATVGFVKEVRTLAGRRGWPLR